MANARQEEMMSASEAMKLLEELAESGNEGQDNLKLSWHVWAKQMWDENRFLRGELQRAFADRDRLQHLLFEVLQMNASGQTLGGYKSSLEDAVGQDGEDVEVEQTFEVVTQGTLDGVQTPELVTEVTLDEIIKDSVNSFLAPAESCDESLCREEAAVSIEDQWEVVQTSQVVTEVTLDESWVSEVGQTLEVVTEVTLEEIIKDSVNSFLALVEPRDENSRREECVASPGEGIRGAYSNRELSIEGTEGYSSVVRSSPSSATQLSLATAKELLAEAARVALRKAVKVLDGAIVACQATSWAGLEQA